MKRYIKASLTSGLVGLWWYHPESETLVNCKCSIDEGSEDYNGFVQYKNEGSHLTEWRKAIKEQLPEYAEELIPKYYKAIERGRVVYDPFNHKYIITCSEEVSKNGRILSKIVDTFNLSGCKYEVIVDIHYHVAPLTGNPALDNFEYGPF